jgi:F0F1-type ATP synthase alpha subunit
VIEHGRRIRAVLSQRQFAPLSLGEQVALLCALNDGILDGVPLERIDAFHAGLHAYLAEHCPDVAALDDASKPLVEESRARLNSALAALARSVVAATPEARADRS